MRYFAELSYKGTRYSGWQRQLNAVSVQQTIETVFETLLRSKVELTGCGRTDAGVHAGQFFAHFDWESGFPEGFLSRVNRMLPPDIALYRIFAVDAEAHARFDATSRSYTYQLSTRKNPILSETTCWFPLFHRVDISRMQEAAALILQYESFQTFCKSDHDALTVKCRLTRSEWIPDESNHLWVYHISSNRFLRGMVRLIVGMCLNVGLGKITLEEVAEALDKQQLLKRAESAPPEGLILSAVKYPFGA